jgi:hypothetical protein
MGADHTLAAEIPRIYLSKIHAYVAANRPPSYKIDFRFMNVGRTPAILYEISHRLKCGDSISPAPEYNVGIHIRDRVLVHREDSVEWTVCELDTEDEPRAARWMNATGDETKNAPVIVFFGYFRYTDVFDKNWKRGFGFRYDPRIMRHPIRLGPAYNYQIEEKT